MEFLDADLYTYIYRHTQDEPEYLQKVSRYTHLNVLRPRMLSGHFQGRLLSMISHMIKPAHVLEIGTYTGYSALCLAEGLSEGGKITTIDINPELEEPVRRIFAGSRHAHQIDFRPGNALEIIEELPGPFDLVFIDADKANYGAYYDLVFDKVKPGGYIIADNVLWSGKVLEKNRTKDDKDTLAILEFNRRVQEDPRVQNVLLPIRDGLMVLRKI